LALALILWPCLAAAVVYAIPSNRWRPALLPLASLGHLALTWRALGEPRVAALGDWLLLDPLGKVVLAFISVLFLLCSLYAPGYLQQRGERDNRVLCGCLLLSLGMMSLMILSHHLGLMWVAMEATTLASAPGIYFNHNVRSLEATWKYLLICSVGIALALLGSFFLAYSCVHARLETSLLVDDLVARAPLLSKPWLHAAFVFLFIGYGTKMGLAPMHTWKPDAYGEAPGMIGCLLAGGLTNCSFLAILRFYQICHAAGDTDYVASMMVFIGLLSMGVAALFMIRQRDFKRMLAYSSVEHMGILILGIGLGGSAIYGALLHLINNGLCKGALFLSAGNIHRAYASKAVCDVQGAARRLPFSGPIFFAGFLAITGSPPFGPFISEFTIANQAFADGTSGHWIAGALLLTFLMVIFLGFGYTVLNMVLGRPSPAAEHTSFHDSLLTTLPPLAFLGLVIWMGLWIPAPLDELLREASSFLTNTTPSTSAIVRVSP